MSRKSNSVNKAYREVFSDMLKRDSLRCYLRGWGDAAFHRPMDELQHEQYYVGYKDGQKAYRKAEASAAKKFGVKLLTVTLQ